MTERGAVYDEQAYRQGKNLDHKDWSGFLPRNITPSDLDIVCTGIVVKSGESTPMIDDNITCLDNHGRILLIEFSSKNEKWSELKYGQRVTYENLVKAGRGQIIAVLAKHNVPIPERINTRFNIISYCLMRWENKIVINDVKHGNEQWQNMIRQFYRP